MENAVHKNQSLQSIKFRKTYYIVYKDISSSVQPSHENRKNILEKVSK